MEIRQNQFLWLVGRNQLELAVIISPRTGESWLQMRIRLPCPTTLMRCEIRILVLDNEGSSMGISMKAQDSWTEMQSLASQ